MNSNDPTNSTNPINSTNSANSINPMNFGDQIDQTAGIDQIDEINQVHVKITRFEDFECWQEARKLVSAVYGTTMNGNFKKDLRLSSQI